MDKGLQMISDQKTCKFFKDKSIVAVGVRNSKLFEMIFKVDIDDVVSFQARVANASEKVDSLKIWHERLGHQNLVQVKQVLSGAGILFNDNENSVCDACVIGKHHRMPFNKSERKTTRPGELIHSDLCGPMQECSLGGSKYFLLFKDDYSRYKRVFFLKEKSSVKKYLVEFLQAIQNETGQNVKTIRTDNGLEFVNKDVSTLLTQRGIRHERTVPYTPQQNGAAEREMRTIVEASRTMIYAKNLPLNCGLKQ